MKTKEPLNSGRLPCNTFFKFYPGNSCDNDIGPNKLKDGYKLRILPSF